MALDNRPTLKELMDHLKEVTDWESLGAFLGIKKYKLTDIQTERRGKLSLCKMDLFDQWLRSDVNASWEIVVKALDTLDYSTLADDLRRIYHLGAAPSGMPAGHQSFPAVANDRGSQPLSTPSPVSQTSSLPRVMSELCGRDFEANQASEEEHKQSILQLAVGHRDLSMIKTLIVLGANLNYKDGHNLTALDTANRLNMPAVFDLIKRCGGKLYSSLGQESSTMDTESGEDEMREQTQTNVLCLDSCSDKVIVQLEVLNKIEQLTGRQIIDMFDYLVGSGLGGAMLLAIVYAKKTVAQLIRWYYQLWQSLASEADPRKKWRKLEELMQELFGGIRMGDVKYPPKVLIAAVNKENTQLKLKFFNNFIDGRDKAILVHRVACYTCATSEYYNVINKDTDNYIDGGAICRNLTQTALTYITETGTRPSITGETGTRPSITGVAATRPSITGVLSVGEGVWPARPLTDDTDFHTCAMDALVEQVHQNVLCHCTSPSMFYYRINPLFPEKTPVKLHLEDIVDIHVNTIAVLVGDDTANTTKKLKKIVCELSA